MKWITLHTWEAKRQYIENWHRWFAWYPVTVEEFPDGGKKKVWLEYIYRKGCHDCSWGECWWNWKYKETMVEEV